ncbi:sulfotransferase family 2 domain-containing protein [Pseudotabrizicola alkalilacus]|nr:sulfotransferase family 2 domain-containing protein [Pseudotabrizicola alkalilacus]
MRVYDPDQPIVFIHVPKTAGLSVREVFDGWFGDGLIRHYFNEVQGGRPERESRFDLHSREHPVCVYGHFNRLRGFGVTDNYPDASQFVTILRDPFEMACSNYRFLRKVSAKWKDQSRVPKGGLAEYLMETAPNMLNHFPDVVTELNFREMIETRFVAIGLTERLNDSLSHIASILGFPYEPTRLGRLNTTEPEQGTSDLDALRAQYRARHPLEFELYDYVRQRAETLLPS